jgi:hypothetical protein
MLRVKRSLTVRTELNGVQRRLDPGRGGGGKGAENELSRRGEEKFLVRFRKLAIRSVCAALQCVLEEVEVLQPLDHRIVNRQDGVRPGDREAGARREVDANRHLYPLGIKLHTLHIPWRGNSEGGFKQLVRNAHDISPLPPYAAQHGKAASGPQGRSAPLRGGVLPSLTAGHRLAVQAARPGRRDGLPGRTVGWRPCFPKVTHSNLKRGQNFNEHPLAHCHHGAISVNRHGAIPVKS